MSEQPLLQPHNLDAEESVLGALMVSEASVDAVFGGTGLTAEHFYRDRHGIIFRAISTLLDRGEPIDALTVVNELDRSGKLADVGGREAVSGLASNTPAPGNAGHYAEIVVEKAVWRQRVQAGQQILAACRSEDDQALATAESKLGADVGRADAEYEPERLAELAWRMAQGDHEPGLEWPFPRLNELRTIRRGNFVVLSGHSHHGKSQIADQLLDHLHKQGHRVRLYMNEMDADERVARTIMRRLGIPTDRLERGELHGNEGELLLEEINRGLGWGLTNIAGWTATELGHHIRRHRWDLCVIDILHNFDYRDEADIRTIVNTLATAAKLAHSAVVVVAHVNRIRTSMTASPVKPRPTGADLRASGSIYDRADVVCFVHREQDEDTGEPLEDAAIWLDKARAGRLGGFRAIFDNDRLEFRPAPRTVQTYQPSMEEAA